MCRSSLPCHNEDSLLLGLKGRSVCDSLVAWSSIGKETSYSSRSLASMWLRRWAFSSLINSLRMLMLSSESWHWTHYLLCHREQRSWARNPWPWCVIDICLTFPVRWQSTQCLLRQPETACHTEFPLPPDDLIKNDFAPWGFPAFQHSEDDHLINAKPCN